MKRYLLICAILLASVSLLAQVPTISSLVVTGSGIKWYDSPTGGTEYTSPATTNLANLLCRQNCQLHQKRNMAGGTAIVN